MVTSHVHGAVVWCFGAGRSALPATLAWMAVAVAMTAAGCSDEALAPDQRGIEARDVAGVTLLTQNVVQDVTMDALYEGVVVEDGSGCLRLGDASGSTVVWPDGYGAYSTLGDVFIVDPEGVEVGQVGGSFSLPGGEVTELSDAMGFTQADRDLAADRCPGRYWIVG